LGDGTKSKIPREIIPPLTDANFRKWSLNFGCAAKLHHTAKALGAPAPKTT
jgi:hypothetical protein